MTHFGSTSGFIMEYYLIVINPPTKKAKHGSDIT
jgi:hypothetical protein